MKIQVTRVEGRCIFEEGVKMEEGREGLGIKFVGVHCVRGLWGRQGGDSG